MSPRVPEAVRRAWGDELVAEVVPWLEQMIEEKAVPRDEHQPILSRLEGLERDMAELKAAIHQLRTEVKTDIHQLRTEVKTDIHQLRTEVKADVHQLRSEMNERFDRLYHRSETHFDQMHERFDQMNQRFEARLDQMSERMLVQTRWLIGSIALFGTILTILMAIAQFAP